MPFKNPKLSYSRLSRYVQCPRSFALKYIEKRPEEVSEPAQFGKAVHQTLECLLREHVARGEAGVLDAKRAPVLWASAFADHGLVDGRLFEDGLTMVHEFICAEGRVDPKSVLAIEQAFEFQLGPHVVGGFIDRIDRTPDGILVRDYKTAYLLPEREELDSNLQLSIYAMAAERMFPGEKVALELHFVRQGVRMRTRRTAAQLNAARLYVETLGTRTEQAAEYPPTLNTYCASCSYRVDCPAYETARAGQMPESAESLEDVAAVVAERQKLVHASKLLKKRQAELDKVLKAQLRDVGEVTAGGHFVKLLKTTRRSYPTHETLETLCKATGLTRAEAFERVGSVDGTALKDLLKEVQAQMGRSEAIVLKAKLDAAAKQSVSTRLWAKEVG